MFSCTVISTKQSIGSNHLDLLLTKTVLRCRLHKALYGLKQSSRVWFVKFSHAVLRFGMPCCQFDHFVFYLTSDVGEILIVYAVEVNITAGSLINDFT